MKNYIADESPLSRWLFSSTASAWLWLVIRLYLAYEWISAGWEKVTNPAWFGRGAGQAITGFLDGALAKTGGANPDVQGWYAAFLRHIILAHPVVWSNVVSCGELAVGIALLLGVFTGIAAFFGLFMNLNYLLAGTVSINPILFTLSIGVILAWKVAGYFGVDRLLLPALGTPWKPGEVFKNLDHDGTRY